MDHRPLKVSSETTSEENTKIYTGEFAGLLGVGPWAGDVCLQCVYGQGGKLSQASVPTPTQTSTLTPTPFLTSNNHSIPPPTPAPTHTPTPPSFPTCTQVYGLSSVPAPWSMHSPSMILMHNLHLGIDSVSDFGRHLLDYFSSSLNALLCRCMYAKTNIKYIDVQNLKL